MNLLMKKNNTQNNNSRTPGAPPALPTRQSFSQEAMAIGERILQLEDDLNHANEHWQDEERRAKIAEGERDRLLQEIREVRTELDHYKGLWTSAEAKFDAAASILLSVMNKRKPENASTASATQSVARAMISQDADPGSAPEFLQHLVEQKREDGSSP